MGKRSSRWDNEFKYKMQEAALPHVSLDHVKAMLRLDSSTDGLVDAGMELIDTVHRCRPRPRTGDLRITRKINIAGLLVLGDKGKLHIAHVPQDNEVYSNAVGQSLSFGSWRRPVMESVSFGIEHFRAGFWSSSCWTHDRPPFIVTNNMMIAQQHHENRSILATNGEAHKPWRVAEKYLRVR